MKRLFVMVIALCMILSIACADDVQDFVASWNGKARIYGAPKLPEDLSGETLEYSGDHWDIAVIFESGSVVTAEIHSDDPVIYLALCATTGATVVKKKTVDTHSQFMANVLSLFLDINNDYSPRRSMFYTYEFTMDKTDGMYTFIMEAQ